MKFAYAARDREVAFIIRLLTIFGVVEQRQMRLLFNHLSNRSYGQILARLRREGLAYFSPDGQFLATSRYSLDHGKTLESVMVFWAFIKMRDNVLDFCASDPPAKVVGYIVTDARGVAASDPLPLGRYFVTEVSAPKYYQLSSEKMEAEIEYPNQIIKLSAYNKSANLGVTIKKTGNREVQPGQVMSYDFSGIGNTSNVALNSFFWHDRIPTDATRAISVTTGTYNARLYYKVTFKTNLSDYRTLASNLLTSNNYSLSLNAATLGLAQGEYVTDVRFEFGTVPSGFASVVKPTMRVQVLGTVSNGYQIINRADVGGQYLNEWQTAKATWVTTVCRFNNNPLPKTGY